MRHRNLHLVMLGFMCLWFGIVVPGHERGLIKTPGPACDTALMSCCPADTTCCPVGDPNSDRVPARDDPAQNCALCDYLATLLTPPVAQLIMPRLGLIDVLPVPLHVTPHVAPARSIFGGRSPPLV